MMGPTDLIAVLQDRKFLLIQSDGDTSLGASPEITNARRILNSFGHSIFCDFTFLFLMIGAEWQRSVHCGAVICRFFVLLCGKGFAVQCEKQASVPQKIGGADRFTKLLRFGSGLLTGGGENGDGGGCNLNQIGRIVIGSVVGELQYVATKMLFSVEADHSSKHCVVGSLVSRDQNDLLSLLNFNPKGIAVQDSVGTTDLGVLPIICIVFRIRFDQITVFLLILTPIKGSGKTVRATSVPSGRMG